MSKFKDKKILVIMTGSIACYKVCTVLSRLKQAGSHLKVVMSPASREFIGAATVEGLTGEPPITDMYSSGNVMDHIHLMRWADLVLVAPATANYINKIAHGVGDDLLTTLFLAHDFQKPFLITPAMNTKMYQHPTTQKSLSALKEMGVEILETASGVLACGEIGSGRLLEPELILNEIALRFPDTTGENIRKVPGTLRILMTAGGTSEPIDDIRVISNKSTGATAAALADSLINNGLYVTYLHAKTAKIPNYECTKVSFESFNELQLQLEKQLLTIAFDYIIHLAAVSDYSVTQQNGKIDSSNETLTLELRKNPKLINSIKRLSPKSRLIGFKLTSTHDENLITKKVNQLFENAHCDLVVQNDWENISQKKFIYRLYEKGKSNFTEIGSSENLHAALFQKIIQLQESNL